jgi:transcriptional regulator with XRE-family HTH domain
MTLKRRQASLTENVIGYLQGRGLTQIGMSRMLNVTRSFISRAARGERNLTVKHMEQLAEELEMTLPELLARATPINTVPVKMRKSFKLMLQGLKLSAEVQGKGKPKEMVGIGM